MTIRRLKIPKEPAEYVMIFMIVTGILLVPISIDMLSHGPQHLRDSCYACAILSFVGGPFILWCGLSLFFPAVFSARFLKYFKNGDYAAAEHETANFLNLLKVLPIARSKLQIAISYSNIGIMRLEQGNFVAADEVLRKAVAIIDSNKSLSKEFLTSAVLNNLAFACLHLNKLDEAKNLAERALKIREDKTKEPKAGSAAPLMILGQVFLQENRYQEAKEYFQKGLTVLAYPYVSILEPRQNSQMNRIESNLQLARIALKLKQLPEAKNLCFEILDCFGANDLWMSPLLLADLRDLIEMLKAAGEDDLFNRFNNYAREVAKRNAEHPYAQSFRD